MIDAGKPPPSHLKYIGLADPSAAVLSETCIPAQAEGDSPLLTHSPIQAKLASLSSCLSRSQHL